MVARKHHIPYLGDGDDVDPAVPAPCLHPWENLAAMALHHMHAAGLDDVLPGGADRLGDVLSRSFAHLLQEEVDREITTRDEASR